MEDNRKGKKIKQDRRQKKDWDTMRAEYDFAKAVRGLTAERYTEGASVVLIEPDVARLRQNSDEPPKV